MISRSKPIVMQSGSVIQTKRHSFIGKGEDDPQSSDKIESSQSSDKSSILERSISTDRDDLLSDNVDARIEAVLRARAGRELVSSGAPLRPTLTSPSPNRKANHPIYGYVGTLRGADPVMGYFSRCL